MRTLAILIMVLAASFGSPLSNYEDQWNEFKVKHNKNYATVEEEQLRHQIFLENLETIQEHNVQFDAGIVKYKKGINQLSDMTHEEFVATLTFRPSNVKNATLFTLSEYLAVEDEVDWRDKGAVTEVKDQGRCGSCYTFSATGALEGQLYIKRKLQVILSEQNILDCSATYGNNGCSGGDYVNAFKYIEENNGVDSEDSYPYEGAVGSCRFDTKNVAGTDSGYNMISEGDENDLKGAVATVGPISVGINGEFLHQYQGGIYHGECSSNQLNHAVLVVGYGTEDGLDYWLVKNSWGSSFGENGYFRLARNQDNLCGIASHGSYPLV